MFKKIPLCELCHKEPAISFSYIDPAAGGAPSGWLFTCNCANDAESYYIKVADLFASPAATVDWLAHMQEKTWMNWPNFMTMMDRFREATDSYGAL
jgi:hypothetical protein